MKTVGVVIPIYNVEKYLRECLNSVINQTYKKLEIILVNDGSTDKNSFNIAKEYTLTDTRITLFNKENGGQSTARNIGIKYFNGEYSFKNRTKILKENSLIEFNVEGDNSYKVYSMYKSHKAFKNEKELKEFKNPNIDYIIFLDSDDYWKVNCIEECIKRMNGVEIVWFKSEPYFEGHFRKKWSSLLELYNYQERIITPIEWLKRSIEYNITSFYFIWSGMIDFDFLKSLRLKFIDRIIHEDHHFGMLLFFQSNLIYVFPREMHIYRIRQNSTINISKGFKYPNHLKDLVKAFDNYDTIKQYYSSASIFFVLNLSIIFLSSQNKKGADLFKEAFFDHMIENAFKIFFIDNDPWKLKPRLSIVLNNYFIFWKFFKNKKLFLLYKYFRKITKFLTRVLIKK
ncbi:glycosyltransferase family 2 protein [Campylobacter novaezeelandiae]|uniref:Glycosyltransferase family 2 protein n=3 Tax=Campylobacter novaezeelandiae TaxID=2267891 RepID=A0A4Q9JWI8_9BACT|nr:glycosyltransferase family 2 protein [Campylobacter novaezeelandiae]MBK1963779.1 glycosyltransferase family 2 protein [Campylobacter novaezeelandiae]TBR81297.1 glycosyltransferase family 2 protein [Campylobacter novaezeelandiae]TBR82614.1 glycosyltransferase family 2 protein [Campylobacter novaezeelandiae]